MSSSFPQMGKTELAVPKSYVANLREFCLTSLPPFFDKIIKEQLPLAAPFNDAFHAGGNKREHLAKMSAFGELSAEALDTVQDAIDRWSSGETSGDGQRPTGSERYEALESTERNQYRVDVLLSIAVALNYADDEGLAERAEADLKARGVAEPSEEQVEEEAFKLARGELDLRSATKTSASSSPSSLSLSLSLLPASLALLLTLLSRSQLKPSGSLATSCRPRVSRRRRRVGRGRSERTFLAMQIARIKAARGSTRTRATLRESEKVSCCAARVGRRLVVVARVGRSGGRSVEEGLEVGDRGSACKQKCQERSRLEEGVRRKRGRAYR